MITCASVILRSTFVKHSFSRPSSTTQALRSTLSELVVHPGPAWQVTDLATTDAGSAVQAPAPVSGLLECGKAHLEDWLTELIRSSSAASTPDLWRAIRKTVALLNQSHTLADVPTFIPADPYAGSTRAIRRRRHRIGTFDAQNDWIRLTD